MQPVPGSQQLERSEKRGQVREETRENYGEGGLRRGRDGRQPTRIS